MKLSSSVRALALLIALLGAAACGSDPDANVPPPADVAAAPSDAIRTGTGLAYKIIVQGDGEQPVFTDRVQVDYTGWTTDGRAFDTTATRGPATFAVSGVILGWIEALQLMRVGSTYRLWIPQGLAYQGQPGRPSGTLVFDVELLAIVR
jgi:peptidylprolyl isomerase